VKVEEQIIMKNSIFSKFVKKEEKNKQLEKCTFSKEASRSTVKASACTAPQSSKT
jgi:hypothetical protein